ncbi:MAG TPA: DUF4846 domain-containing protein [Phycisphaerae bacterium]|nr:DUF4846 domain-containing protein [Phycisphaerae bacterium]
MLNHLFMDDVPGHMDAAAPNPATSLPNRRRRWIRSIGAVVAIAIVLLGARRTSSPTSLQSIRSSPETISPIDQPAARGPAPYAWLTKREAAKYVPLIERIPTPEGFSRIPAPAGSFAAWLRNLPVAPEGTPVTTGKRKLVMSPGDSELAAVILLQPRTEKALAGPNMLVRLRAEYCWATKRLADLGFHFTSGHLAAWGQWAEGRRPNVSGKTVAFAPMAEPDGSRESFCSYLETIFQYCSVYSVFDDTRAVEDGSIAPGDVFLRPGKNACSLLVVDVATSARGEVAVLLGDAGTPAQTFHLIQPPTGSAWFPIVQGDDLAISAKRILRMRDLRRWK